MILSCKCFLGAVIKQIESRYAQSLSYDDTASTSSQIDARGNIPSTGKPSRNSSSSSFKSSASSITDDASKHSSKWSSRAYFINMICISSLSTINALAVNILNFMLF